MLRLESISKTFNPGTANETLALDNLSLSLNKGEFVVVIGGNGSGKSTTLNAIAGVFPVDEGKIILDDADDATVVREYKYKWMNYLYKLVTLPGRILKDLKRRISNYLRRVLQGSKYKWAQDLGSLFKEPTLNTEIDMTMLPEYKRATYLGRVFQDPMLGTATDMTIEENLAVALRRGKKRGLRKGVPKSEREFYREALKQLDLGLENRLTNKIGLLSGGQRQAITLLMATIKKPKLLLLDEHTAALDPKTAAKVLELSDKLIRRDNLTTLMVTHNMKDAIQYGDRLIMMDAGRIIFEASGEEKRALSVKDIIEKFSIVRAVEEY